MKIIIAPDKFKGSLTSLAACYAIRDGILGAGNDFQVLVFPMADGGDGFAEVMKYYLHTETRFVDTVDPLGRNISSCYEWENKKCVAIIELASSSGLVILNKEEQNPMITSTFGTGVLMMDAIEKGAKKIILGIGGSATNDAGIGILAALGFTFLDDENNTLSPCGENLIRIKKVTSPAHLPTMAIEISGDVSNPLYGPNGAAYIFSPQKGATTEQVQQLDEGLKHFSDIIKRDTGKDVAWIPGTGAAGGIAAGLMGYLDAKLTRGTKIIIHASEIKNFINDADFIITGEGKLDQQSLGGKTISAITAMAKEKNISVVALCGKVELTETEWRQLGLSLALEINDASMNEQESMKMATAVLKSKAKSIVPLLRQIAKKSKKFWIRAQADVVSISINN